jgi:hypothetical protein
MIVELLFENVCCFAKRMLFYLVFCHHSFVQLVSKTIKITTPSVICVKLGNTLAARVVHNVGIAQLAGRANLRKVVLNALL